jgi:hypothetical protein
MVIGVMNLFERSFRLGPTIELSVLSRDCCGPEVVVTYLLIRYCTASTDGMITGINSASSFGALTDMTRVSSSPQSTAGTECTFVGSNAEQWRFHSEEVVSVKGDSNRGYDVDQERGRVSAGRP